MTTEKELINTGSVYRMFFMIKDSNVGSAHMPTCTTLYKNRDSYMLVEVNTGAHIGSIKVISEPYSKIGDLMCDPIVTR
jgi:hypothetical protein